MEITFLLISLTCLLFAFIVVTASGFVRQETETKESGHDVLVVACYALLRIGKRKILHMRRLFLAYVLHLSVRALRVFDRVSFYLYAKSRNLFIKNAVKHKGTVPFFWEYLKTYKQEIDREREFLLKDED